MPKHKRPQRLYPTAVAGPPALGIHTLSASLLQCKGVENVVSQDDATHAPGSDAEDVEFTDHELDDDEFDVSSFEPSYTSAGSGKVPAMPTIVRPPQHHREKIPILQAPFIAAVARAESKKEMYSNPKAQAAVRIEWDRLREKRCWSEKKEHVREWRDVAAEARRDGTTVHVGRLCCLCVEKGSELKPTIHVGSSRDALRS